MRHSHLNKRKAFAFIVAETEAGRQPTDAQLMDLCGLYQVDHIKTLLADLSDEGAIQISWAGAERTIALGRRECAKLEPARPVPSITRPRLSAPVSGIDEETAAARIMSIVNRGTPSPPQPDVEVTTEAQAEFDRHRAAFNAKPSLVPEGRRQLSFSVPGEVYLAIAAQAEKVGDSVAAAARRIFADAYDAKLCDTRRKHKISAEVQRAWLADPSGLDLPTFVTGLIEVGLRELHRYAEAAE